MAISQAALLVLQQMMGEEGAVFMRDLPINYFLSTKTITIPWDKSVSPAVFQELKELGCIRLHIQSHNWEQWAMTDVGRTALRDARMETLPGILSRDDIGWLTGTGHYAQ